MKLICQMLKKCTNRSNFVLSIHKEYGCEYGFKSWLCCLHSCFLIKLRWSLAKETYDQRHEVLTSTALERSSIHRNHTKQTIEAAVAPSLTSSCQTVWSMLGWKINVRWWITLSNVYFFTKKKVLIWRYLADISSRLGFYRNPHFVWYQSNKSITLYFVYLELFSLRFPLVKSSFVKQII